MAHKSGEVILNLPGWHRGQKQVWAERQRFNFLDAGRGWRKTSFLMTIAVQHLLTGRNAGWYAPTYKHILNALQEFHKGLGHIAEFNKSEMWMKIPGKGTLFFYSLEIPDNARGTTYPLILVDEAAFVPDGVYDAILYPIAAKAFATFNQGDVWCVSTPNGRNWFWRQWMLAQAGEPNMASWYAPALGCEIVDEKLVRKPHALENPAYIFEEMDRLFRTMARRQFRVEILAEFLDDEGSQFSGVAAISTLTPKDPMQGRFYQIGVDIGMTNDYTVISVLDTQTMQQVYMRRFTGMGWPYVYDSIAETARKYPGKVVVDATGAGSHVPMELGRRGIPCTAVKFTNTNKLDMMDHLAVLIEHQKVRFLNDPIQVFEFQAYQRIKTPAGNIQLSAPPGLHDDTVTAAGLMTLGLNPPLIEETATWNFPVIEPSRPFAWSKDATTLW